MAHKPLHTLTDEELGVIETHPLVPARDRQLARTILVNRAVRADNPSITRVLS